MTGKIRSDRGTPEYWASVAAYGLPVEDWHTWTCEGDTGYGPCGTYLDWAEGRCAAGHEIERRESE